jgi:hypothetical protein
MTFVNLILFGERGHNRLVRLPACGDVAEVPSVSRNARHACAFRQRIDGGLVQAGAGSVRSGAQGIVNGLRDSRMVYCMQEV